MKKFLSVIMILVFVFLIIISVNVHAVALPNVDVTINKQIVHPGDTIKLEMTFGQELGSYTVDVAYDNNLLEYVSSEGGTANDNGTRVRVYYFDAQGGTNPRNNMSVTFKAKQDILTSNPTNLSVTAEGLSNPDASVSYDDITTPIVKDVVVEPIYEDYKIDLIYSGNILKEEEKEMELTISSSMGKNYEHTRILAEAKTPTGADIKLLASDSQNLEHDLIQSGYGDAGGDPIGGKNVSKKLSLRGLFSKEGEYTIKFKLIDRDNADAVIAEKSFTIQVSSSVATPPNTNNPDQEIVPPQEETPSTNEGEDTITQESKKPNALPKTGEEITIIVLAIIMILTVSFILLQKRK